MSATEPAAPVRFALDLDVGEIADGHHLIVRSVSLTADDLLFEYEFRPELTEEARNDVWPNMNYGSDVSLPHWSRAWSEAEVYERPPPEARHAWFDFFRPDFEWNEHLLGGGEPDSAYLQNRIARLTFDLETGQAHIER
jgi:hypothetical protein